MKKLLFLLLALLPASFANAYTVDEILSLGGAGYSYYSPYTTSPHGVKTTLTIVRSEGVRLEKIDDTHIWIRGLGEAKLSYRFTLCNNRLNESADGTLLVHDNNDAPEETNNWRMINCDGSRIILTIFKDSNGSPWSLRTTNTYTSHPFFAIYRPYLKRFDTGCAERAFSAMTIDLFEPNAEATDNFRSYYGVDSCYSIVENDKKLAIHEADRVYRTYPMLVESESDWRGNTTLKLTNLGDNGYAFDDYRTPLFRISAKVNQSTNAVTINRVYARSYPYSTFVKDCYIDDTNKTATVIDTLLWVTTYDLYYLEGFDHYPEVNGIDFKETITGQYTPKELAHNKIPHAWVTNRGKRKTFEGFHLTLSPYTYHIYYNIYDDVYKLDFEGGYFDTDIQGNNDVTLDVDLKLTDFKWHPGVGAMCTGEIKTNKNGMYVDHYDIMVVPGLYDHIEQAGFEHDLDMGHVLAKLYVDNADDAFDKDANAASAPAKAVASNGIDYSFSKFLSREFLGETVYPVKGKYTFFIRANYKPETGLTPTFHSLQYMDVPQVTGVEEFEYEIGRPQVEVEGNEIVIKGSDAPVSIFNTAGALVYMGSDRRVALPAPGIYVVAISNYTTKVIVK